MRRLAAFLVCLVVLVVVVRDRAVAADQDHESIAVFTGSCAIESEQYRYIKFHVDADRMHGPELRGHLTASGGSGDDIEVLVLTASDLSNWQHRHDTHPLYSSGRVTAADVRAAFTESGDYFLVISNAFSTVAAKTVEGNVALRWELPDEGGGLFVLLVMAVIVIAIVWALRRKKKAGGAPPA